MSIHVSAPEAVATTHESQIARPELAPLFETAQTLLAMNALPRPSYERMDAKERALYRSWAVEFGVSEDTDPAILIYMRRSIDVAAEARIRGVPLDTPEATLAYYQANGIYF